MGTTSEPAPKSVGSQGRNRYRPRKYLGNQQLTEPVPGGKSYMGTGNRFLGHLNRQSFPNVRFPSANVTLSSRKVTNDKAD